MSISGHNSARMSMVHCLSGLSEHGIRVVVANGLHSDIKEIFLRGTTNVKRHIAYRAVVPGFQAIPQASAPTSVVIVTP